MKVVEDIEKIDERSVFDGIYVQEKLVAWCAVCDVVHFYVCEKVRKGPQWEHFSEADIFSSV